MITIQTQSDGVLFNFQDSTRYLYGDGSILTPYNSLTLIADESNVLTFRKSASNDIFITAGYDELGYSSKEEAINDLKTKLFKATGGSESGITSGDVETIIDAALADYYTDDEVDAALSGKADASDVTEEISAAVSGKADTTAVTAVSDALTAHTADTGIHVSQLEKDAWNAKLDASAYTPTDLSEYYTKGQTDGLLDEKLDASAYTPTDLSNYYTKQETNGVVDGAVSGKADTSAVTAVENEITVLGNALAGKANTAALTAHTSDTDIHVSAQEKNAWNAKAEPYSAGTGIEISGNVISATGGGGATYSAGTNISIDTANTINCTLNFDNGSGNGSIQGKTSTASGLRSIAFGNYSRTINAYESSFGEWNDSKRRTGTTDTTGTVFTVGNGANSSNYHNALEIRQNGDIYFPDTDNASYAQYYKKPMVRLQDMYGALSNKLETSAITSAITSASTNAEVAGAKAVYDAIQAGGGGGGSVTVDSELDMNSSNPVENQAIAAPIEDIYNALDGSYNDGTPMVKLKRISQSDYDDLVDMGTTDSDTLYIITPDEPDEENEEEY